MMGVFSALAWYLFPSNAGSKYQAKAHATPPSSLHLAPAFEIVEKSDQLADQDLKAMKDRELAGSKYVLPAAAIHLEFRNLGWRPATALGVPVGPDRIPRFPPHLCLWRLELMFSS